MGSIILCHPVKAKQPYAITGADLSIYTIEELCYYLYHNLYLVDHTIMSMELCQWLEEELELGKLADKLRKEVEFGISLQGFVLPIFEQIGYLNEYELEDVKKQLQVFKRQTETEKRKFKADNLIRNRRFVAAIYEYEHILLDKKNEKLMPEFLGQLYHNMGSAYAGLYLFKKAAGLFMKSYQYIQKASILKEFLTASYLYMDEQAYFELISEKEEYGPISREVIEEQKQLKADEGNRWQEQLGQEEERLKKWRLDYEKSIAG